MVCGPLEHGRGRLVGDGLDQFYAGPVSKIGSLKLIPNTKGKPLEILNRGVTSDLSFKKLLTAV